MIRKHFRLLLFIISAVIVFSFVHNFAEAETKPVLYKSVLFNPQVEIGMIKFEGNKGVTTEILESLISTGTSDRSLPYSLFEFSYIHMIKNSMVPNFIKNDLNRKRRNMINRSTFFYNENTINADVDYMRQYYQQRGYHDVVLSYTFKPNLKKHLNELTFIISEGPRYSISKAEFNVEPNLPSDVDSTVKSFFHFRRDVAHFNETRIITMINNSLSYLKNSGYYFAYAAQPSVVIDKENKTDSVYTEIFHGPRCKIGAIKFTETFNKQKRVNPKLLESLVEFKSGDLYRPDIITKTESNFLSLNTFQYVKIDTSGFNPADSTLDFLIDLRYRKQQEYGVSTFINRTMFDKYVNLGTELSYTHKNAFGSAQVFSPFARVVMLDLNRSLTDLTNAEYEYQFGFSLSQPLLWSFDNSKVGIISQILYSKRTIYNELNLKTFSLPVKFPITLPKWTYFNLGSIEFDIERQVPDNYPEAIDRALQHAADAQDTIDIFKQFVQFSGLYDFVHEKHPYLTSTTIGFNLAGDTRNDPFSPSSGHYTSFSLDLAPVRVNKYSGVSNFMRLQFLWTNFKSYGAKSVFATKFRIGHIFWFDQSNSIVPYERQFFAGGANSIRGWGARRLRYYGVSQRDIKKDDYYRFTEDYIGSTSIIEGSFEWRFHPLPINRRHNEFQQMLEPLSFAVFIDYGNAYQWFLYQDSTGYTYKPKAIDYLKGIAVADGFGIRYDTPVGVIRLDLGWKLYNPNHRIDPDLYPAIGKLNDIQFQIGLGNAF